MPVAVAPQIPDYRGLLPVGDHWIEWHGVDGVCSIWIDDTVMHWPVSLPVALTIIVLGLASIAVLTVIMLRMTVRLLRKQASRSRNPSGTSS